MSEPEATARSRVAGFDLLRGLCALGVAVYHMLFWTKQAELHTFELYGVYIFFVLSGASMTIAYAPRFARGYPVAKYLALRFVRLAPLYAALATYNVVVRSRLSGASVELGVQYFLNVTFLMGFANPGETSLVTGGWSLGIEFVFYLLFPLAAAIARARWFRWLALSLCAAQLLFVNGLMAKAELHEVWVRYTQFAAFMGYFAAGVAIGAAVHQGHLTEGGRFAWFWWLILVVLLGALGAPTARETLVGARGVVLMGLSIAVVVVSARLPFRGALPERLAGALGDASYPMYLLHPVIFAVLGSRHLLQSTSSSSPRAFVGLALAITFGASLATWRWFERPILEWGKRRLA